MKHSTPLQVSPSEESLKFIRAFARLYSPESDNESEARSQAQSVARTSLAPC